MNREERIVKNRCQTIAIFPKHLMFHDVIVLHKPLIYQDMCVMDNTKNTPLAES